ncbi:hypothetical protein JOB18_020366 [Solea senegalensis]|uniref:Uncharacterized protein n=1 Tax=Solea senegalensis TaxID=28829 RepID=A0AAV6RY61_SOLSE|nr:hypothetical protein JOB18_020366 [Solea senegalensis]
MRYLLVDWENKEQVRELPAELRGYTDTYKYADRRVFSTYSSVDRPALAGRAGDWDRAFMSAAELRRGRFCRDSQHGTANPGSLLTAAVNGNITPAMQGGNISQWRKNRMLAGKYCERNCDNWAVDLRILAQIKCNPSVQDTLIDISAYVCMSVILAFLD